MSYYVIEIGNGITAIVDEDWEHLPEILLGTYETKEEAGNAGWDALDWTGKEVTRDEREISLLLEQGVLPEDEVEE
jgi:hypothetical protein